MRRFGGDRRKGLMEWAGMSEDVPIENAMVSKVIENAQVKVEGYHFDIRKHLVDYDDVINRHREVIYGERTKILEGADLKANVLSMVGDEIRSLVAGYYSDDPDQERLTWTLHLCNGYFWLGSCAATWTGGEEIRLMSSLRNSPKKTRPL